MTHNKIYNLKASREFQQLKKDRSVEYKISSKDININGIHKLLFSCEDASTATLKNESGAELLYMLIDDSLNYEMAEKSRYCLDFSTKKPIAYSKRAFKKIMWQPLVYGLYNYDQISVYNNNWCYGLWAKAENLHIEADGYLRFRIDIWKVKDDVNPHDTTAAPDESHIIDISQGSYGYTKFKKDITIDKDSTACVMVTLEGENYSGKVYFELPFLEDNSSRNFLPEFERGIIGLTRFAWLGQNLSKREWPHLKIAVNDQVFFDDEVFLKVHRFTPIEIPLPRGSLKDGENIISITYTSDYIDTIPLLIDEALLLEKDHDLFNVINCPEEAQSGKNINLLIEIEIPDVDPEVISEDFTVSEITKFTEFNLQVVTLRAIKEQNDLKFTLKYKNVVKEYNVKRYIKKRVDNIIVGSGDMVYIDISDMQSVCDYIKWYVANDIGKLITIRPVYRWGGQRTVNADVWKLFTKLCEKLGLWYVHLSDGRDIPGLATNPSYEMLNAPNFLGRQLHERDGQLFYWSPAIGHPREIAAPLEEFFDFSARLSRECPDTIEGSYRSFNIEWTDFGYSYKRKFCNTPDMLEIHNIVSKELQDLSSDRFMRHTGPSVMFKYFYQNGFKWTGAETMDGATEVLLAFLRGSSKAYDKDKYGVHLALQWSTFPHDTAQRYRRYLLSLYIPYMHGVTDINTEEGLWFMEASYAYHNRISEACEKHREQLRRFNKFTRTHSRTGEFYTPIAFLHGRYDGWNGFNTQNTWGMPFMKLGDDAASWQVLKMFYPLNTLSINGCYKTGCITPDNDKPFGLFSGTPNGNVDVIPVEHGDFSKYQALIFSGYNYATQDDLNRISEYVSDGGLLVCSWAHFTDTTLKKDIEEYKLNIVNHKLTCAMSEGISQFVADYVSGKQIMVCTNPAAECEVIKNTDNGVPLVYSVNYGKGQIVVVNSLYYPGNEILLPIYNEVVKYVCDKILQKENCRVECGVDVEYTIFEQNNGTRHYYFTAVDWYNNSEMPRKAKFIMNGHTYPIDIPFGTIVKLVTNGKTAVWPENDSAEVISINEDSFEAQGYGCEIFFVAKEGRINTYTVDFASSSTLVTNLNKKA